MQYKVHYWWYFLQSDYRYSVGISLIIYYSRLGRYLEWAISYLPFSLPLSLFFPLCNYCISVIEDTGTGQIGEGTVESKGQKDKNA